jgi:serpin B
MAHSNHTHSIASFVLFFMVTLAAGADPAADQESLVTANTGFAFDLMNQIAQAQPDANVFISPFSVSSVLQIVNNGAAGGTKTEMQQMLKTSGLAAEPLNAACQSLDQQFTARKDVTLNLANGLWVQQGFRLKPAFVADNGKYFQAELANVDFGNPQSAQTINGWADRQTRGKIKEVVQFPFPPLTRLILANAIYFKGTWSKPFKKDLTQPRDFHLANGPAKPTPMMAQNGHFPYQETADFQAVKLPYRGGLQMELYLPQTNSNPRKLLAGFIAGQDWQKNIQSGFGGREGSVTLPKFKIEYQVGLNGPLQALGMKSAFGQDADFSGIADEPLSISEVKQKSFVEVNEQGTEAAAVTTVTMTALAIRMPETSPFTMVLDRPFFFVISDMATGSILFMGIVNNPAASQ